MSELKKKFLAACAVLAGVVSITHYNEPIIIELPPPARIVEGIVHVGGALLDAISSAEEAAAAQEDASASQYDAGACLVTAAPAVAEQPETTTEGFVIKLW